MRRQGNEDFVQKHVITDRESERITLQNHILSLFILNISVSMDLWLIIFVPSCFPRQATSNDTHDDPNGPSLQFDPGHGQGHHIAVDVITCGVTPPKWTALPKC